MNIRVAFLVLMVTAFLFVGAFGPAAAAPENPNPNGRSLGNAIEGAPGVWRVHFALLGVEDGNGKLFGSIASEFAQAGMMGEHASGR